jgi:transaldolase
MYLKELKFSLWADFIERDYLDDGFLKLIKSGVINGATSNPAIFKNAILTSSAYKDQLASLEGLTLKQKYEAVAIFDIQKAADILNPLYEKGDDGYVSIEVDPFLCDDAQATIDEAKRLHRIIARDNVMIKIPATSAGYEAMEELVASGIPVNATLIFSKKQAIACVKAFERGLVQTKNPVDTVVSVFVSRIDRALDEQLARQGLPTALGGIYNAARIYAAVEDMDVQGCRTLFASTGVKGDHLKPSYYIDGLLGFNSINTAPIETIESYVKEGSTIPQLPIDTKKIEVYFESLKKGGIDFDAVVDKQVKDGLDAFKTAFQDILENL